MVGLLLSGLVVAGPAHAAPADVWSSAYAGGGNSANNPGERVLTAENGRRVVETWTVEMTRGTTVAPAVVGGVVYQVVTQVGGPERFTALSARTGAELWSLALPKAVYRGPSIVGGRAVIPFTPHLQHGGVLAVDLASRSIAWSRTLEPPPNPGWAQVGAVTVDGSRVYVVGGPNDINAWRISDGRPLWSVRDDSFWVPGLAAAGGRVFANTSAGLIAYDATSGRRLWSGVGGEGMPVVAGNRVLVADHQSVFAFAAGGCGQATCRELWRTSFGQLARQPLIGGADGSVFFATYTLDEGRQGRIARLSTSDGRIRWTAPAGRYSLYPSRGGGTVWLINEYVTSDSKVRYRVLGFAASASGTAPLRALDLGSERAGLGAGGIAVSSGTVVVQTWPDYLTGYRVPGT